MKIFIGFDSKYPKVYQVCRRSIERYSTEHEIIPIDKNRLIEQGLYWRDPVPGESTDFAFTRFLVPYLSNFEGNSLFCDNDFMWRCDPEELTRFWPRRRDVAIADTDLMVVKHQLSNKVIHAEKMNGVVNKSYPKKCWTSLMFFKNKKFKHMTPEYVNTASPSDLHEIAWCDEDKIADLPLSYNHLVGYYDSKNPRSVHYTNGGPWLGGAYENEEFAEEWFEILNSL